MIYNRHMILADECACGVPWMHGNCEKRRIAGSLFCAEHSERGKVALALEENERCISKTNCPNFKAEHSHYCLDHEEERQIALAEMRARYPLKGEVLR